MRLLELAAPPAPPVATAAARISEIVGAGAGAGSSSTGMVAESPSLSGMAIARAGSLLPSRYALILERS
jgi:hypothetical protein